MCIRDRRSYLVEAQPAPEGEDRVVKKQPWMKFYPSDWRADASLRMCSPAARLLWLEMLCLMHEAEPRGHLLVKGRKPTERQLAMLTGMEQREVEDGLAELREAEVFDEIDGVVVSRKMVRDTEGKKNSRWGPDAAHGTRSERLAAARSKATHTPDEWLKLKAFCRHLCVKCGSDGPLVKDHIVPVYQGGSDGIENLQPLCNRCNSSKGPDTTDHRPDGWRNALNASRNASTDATQIPDTRSQNKTVAAAPATAGEWPAGKPLDHAKLLVEACGTAYLDTAREPGLIQTLGRLHAWQRDGASWEHDVVPVVTALVGKARRPVKSWAYFDEAIADSIAANRRALDIPEHDDVQRPDPRQRSNPHDDRRRAHLELLAEQGDNLGESAGRPALEG